MANDFSDDANCKALWQLENGALTTDNKGGNTLTNNNAVTADTVNYKEGLASGDFEVGSGQYLSIADSDLDIGFPFRNGDSHKEISICFWFKAESFPSAGTVYVMYSKYDSGGSRRSFSVDMLNTAGTVQIRIGIGYNGGAAVENKKLSTALSIGRWYHLGVTLRDSNRSYRIRLWDDDLSSATELTGAYSNNINIEDADVAIGAIHGGAVSFDGLIDEVVIFNDILTQGEIDQIRAGTYTLISHWAKILTADPDNIATNDYCKLTAKDITGRSYAEVKTDLGLVIGTNVLAYDAGLQNLAGVAMAADKFYYTSGDNTHVAADVTSFARTILDDANAATAATTLGLGTGDSPLFAAVSIGNADTTITRVSAGVIAVEGTTVMLVGDAPTAHVHDGDTLQLDSVNSNGGAFAFTTSGAVTFSQAVTVQGASVTVGVASTTTGTLVLHDSNSANTITLTVPDISAGSLTFTLPPTDGDNTNVLQTDGNGVLTWVAVAAGGAHAILDGSVHTDSVADAVTRGSLIYGNSTPKWDELVVGTGFLRGDGTDCGWLSYANSLAAMSGQGAAAFDLNGQDLTNGGVLFLTEQAAAEANVAGKGQFFVKNDAPNIPMFDDDAGTSYPLYGRYVSRGDPAAYDFGVGSGITTDGNWNNLDCSGIVPVNAIAINFVGQFYDETVGNIFFMRKEGNSNNYVFSAAAIFVSNQYMYHDWVVQCDTSRVVEYQATNTTWTIANLCIKGWWLG